MNKKSLVKNDFAHTPHTRSDPRDCLIGSPKYPEASGGCYPSTGSFGTRPGRAGAVGVSLLRQHVGLLSARCC